MFKKVPIIILFLIALSSCSKKQEEIIYQPLEKTNPYELYKEGLASFEAAHPDVPVITGKIDRTLNDQKYILPGLGDFGDRLYDT